MGENMKGFFKFNLTANDGEHESSVPVKIVIISIDNKISITFDNSLSDVQNLERNITKIFNSLFPNWIFNIDSYPSQRDLDETTTMECHFLDRATFEPVHQATADG